MLKEKPDFDADADLYRFIDEIYYQDTNRASPAAFMEDEDATHDGLSVNSGEVETLNQVAANFSSKWSSLAAIGKRPSCLRRRGSLKPPAIWSKSGEKNKIAAR